MCERRTRKIRKGSLLTRQREMRRMLRLQRTQSLQGLLVPSGPPPEQPPEPFPPPQPVDKTAQNRLIIELALKTISLMQKNTVIQQKITALRKETSDFVASVMSNPDNRQRYMDHMRIHGEPAASATTTPHAIEIRLISSMGPA